MNELKGKISGGTELHGKIGIGKAQGGTTYTFDTTPTLGSDNPVTSDGIAKALDDKFPKDKVATESELGLVRANGSSGGISVDGSGFLRVVYANMGSIIQGTNTDKAVPLNFLGQAVGWLFGTQDLNSTMYLSSDAQKKHAREQIGAVGSEALRKDGQYQSADGLCTMVLENNTFIPAGSSPIQVPISVRISDEDVENRNDFTFESGFSFWTQTTDSISLVSTDNIQWVGVDCDSDGMFIPQMGKRYEVSVRALMLSLSPSPHKIYVARVGVF